MFNRENFMLKTNTETRPSESQASLRRRTVIDTARRLGLLGGQNGRIGGRVQRDLVAAAKEKAHLP